MKFGKISQVAAFSAALAFGLGGPMAFADPISVSYLAPGVQSQTSTPGVTFYTETFNSGLGAGGTTTFGGSSITGTYTNIAGSYQILPADQYGGAGGTGNYAVSLNTTNPSTPTAYSLTLSTPVNYFGYWLSAQDPGDQLQIYSGDTLLYTFTPAVVNAALGNCPGGPYCSNPNNGLVPESNYAFVQFYSGNTTFDKIVFTELYTGNGYESDNHTVANLNATPTGIPVNPVPEPSSLVLLGTGVLGVAGTLRRKLVK